MDANPGSRGIIWIGMDSSGMEKFGDREEERKLMKSLLSVPQGLIVVSGLPQSGKSTTLSSFQSYLDLIERESVTTVDPIFNPGTVTLAFEAVRQDRLVLGSLEAADTASSIVRLGELGASPGDIGEMLEAIFMQRLIRTLCGECKHEIKTTEEMLTEIGLTPRDVRDRRFFRGRGCFSCDNTGYKGRRAVLEIMLMTDRIKELILKKASTEQLRHAAREQGMRTLRESALLAAFDGTTTIEEAGSQP